MNDAQKICKQIKQAKQKKFDVNMFYKKVLDIFYKENKDEIEISSRYCYVGDESYLNKITMKYVTVKNVTYSVYKNTYFFDHDNNQDYSDEDMLTVFNLLVPKLEKNGFRATVSSENVELLIEPIYERSFIFWRGIKYKEISPEERRTITVHKLKISACCKNTLKAKKQNESEK